MNGTNNSTYHQRAGRARSDVERVFTAIQAIKIRVLRFGTPLRGGGAPPPVPWPIRLPVSSGRPVGGVSSRELRRAPLAVSHRGPWAVFGRNARAHTGGPGDAFTAQTRSAKLERGSARYGLPATAGSRIGQGTGGGAHQCEGPPLVGPTWGWWAQKRGRGAAPLRAAGACQMSKR